MATKQTGKSPGWRARVKIKNIEHHIGTFPTKEEAEEAETAYKVKKLDDNLLVECWCRSEFLLATAKEIQDGETRSCGKSDCHK